MQAELSDGVTAEQVQKRQVTILVSLLEDVIKLPIGWWLWRTRASRICWVIVLSSNGLVRAA